MPEKLIVLGSSEAMRMQARMHSAYFEELVTDWICELREVSDEEEAHKIIEKKAFSAIILDDPYKELGIQCAEIKAASAKLAFGAGLLVCKDKLLLAYELEGISRATYLTQKGINYAGALVLVAEQNSCALADVFAAALFGARKVIYISNNKQEAKRRLQAFVAEFGNLAYATIDLPPADKNRLSFREAYEQTSFSFGSYRSSTKAFEEADLIIDHRQETNSEININYAVSIQETLEDVFQLDFDMPRKDMFSIMAAAYNQE